MRGREGVVARSDLLLELAAASVAGDVQLARRAIETLAAEERRKGHDLLAERLSETLPTVSDPESRSPVTQIGSLARQVLPRRDLCSLLLTDETRSTIGEVIEEQQRGELLSSYGLEPRHRLLFSGPPGNGKTSLAEAVAFELAVPLFIVRYESIIGSFLGETAARVAQLLELVRTRRCVLFFDEFDAIAKERSDAQETGEIKRVVSSLLLNIDDLPSHVVVITATNHAEMLDRAVWRRFQVRLELPMPNPVQRASFLEAKFRQTKELEKIASEPLARSLPVSYSELEEFYLDIRRRLVLSGPEGDARSIIRTRLKQWKQRSRVSPR